jgi:hypothetical protein
LIKEKSFFFDKMQQQQKTMLETILSSLDLPSQKNQQHPRSLSTKDFHLLQQVIYFFNEHDIRDYIMNVLLRQLYPEAPFTYLGTLNVHLQDQNLMIQQTNETLENVLSKSIPALKNKKKKEKNDKPEMVDSMFTICIHYEDVKVHFVSFVYEMNPPRLVSFDSGSNLYTIGEKTVIPEVQRIFEKLELIPSSKHKNHKHHIGICSKRYFMKKFGIQFSGENPIFHSLPADAFCQSWSIFFLIEWVRHHHKTRHHYPTIGKPSNGHFVRQWCKIIPSEREWFIISTFFIPLLSYNPFIHAEFAKHYPNTHICKLIDYMLEEKWKFVPQITNSQKK